ncbi:M20 family metallopeptidase [Erwinia amylovora]|uniref:M20 aminoacylase family protein n=1 Tax=Erwinia amylovora TaxID=552 RepID=UPI0020BFC10C|nr:M20 aminoacylase family protein [Erwinia amylovora]MCK8192822.1 M20 family metallopeptidase [Erwinia amylovora]MCK8206173.1 M20 family metallopeptidase [Erwinia amylovora]MCK8212253.1 M20 family metallopeptidase [Erwinia amylovora]MCK8222359.1 M20 family metallopeptidase [Erwinia amylovora]MCK8225762.1 M20 family metallopeptidase [Erwinia amylovora]
MTIPDSLIAEATAWRRKLHACPELGYQEHQTAQTVAEQLTALGLQVHRGLAGTGVVATLENGPGPAIGLRADMDALPITELGNPDHRSTRPGVMHACGHDGHTAILLAAAKHLSRTRRFSGSVHFVFQPAEENLGGARRMVEEGLFTLFPMEAIYGMHNWPGLAAGDVAVNEGAMMASLDSFEITLRGRSCHAAMPENGADPVVAAAQLILALQTIPSRRLSPLASAVVSITQINGGEAINVIPEVVVLRGTLRCLQADVRLRVRQMIDEFVTAFTTPFGIVGSIDYQSGYPVTVNDAQQAARVRDGALTLLPAERVHWNSNPSMASEDFACMLEACPGAYFWLGADGASASAPLHNAHYDFNDALIGPGIALWTALVEQQLMLKSSS